MPAPPSAEHDPCDGWQAVTCRRVGVDQVAGRSAVQWEMSVTREGKTLTGTQWLDVERGLPLKYAMPNGQAMELKQLGTETIAGRAVEKWEMTVTMPNQTPVRTLQWFDPVLKPRCAKNSLVAMSAPCSRLHWASNRMNYSKFQRITRAWKHRQQRNNNSVFYFITAHHHDYDCW